MANFSSTPDPLTGPRASMADYVKHAFRYHWNLLLFGAGAVAAVLSPFPDALLPLLGAAELTYLGLMVSQDKFRKAIDAKVYQDSRQPKAVESQRTLQGLFYRLPPASRYRFEKIKARCVEMSVIAQGVRGAVGTFPDRESSSALDRLLWVFLRLLVSEHALQQFLNQTDAEQIRRQLDQTEKQLESATDERLKNSLQDSAGVHRHRLENWEKAAANANFVRVELDRIEAKIQAITESSVNRQDAAVLSSQIDAAAESMQTTEKAISDLSEITGMMDEMEEPPEILLTDLSGSGGGARR